MTQIPKPWVSKKITTNPQNKEKHNQRKLKKKLIYSLSVQDWLQEVKIYNNNKKEI